MPALIERRHRKDHSNIAKSALFVAWGPLIPGREEAAGRVLGEALQMLQEMQKAGAIDSFETVALEPHGGKLAGFVLLKGDKDTLMQFRSSAEFARVAARIQIVHTDVAVIGAYCGAEMMSLFEMWDRQIEELT